VTQLQGVTISRRVDSLGLPISVTESEGVTTHFAYDDWGDRTEVTFSHPTAPVANRKVIYARDARGRLLMSFEMDGGLIVPDTLRSFAYDEPQELEVAGSGAPVTPGTNLAGRLAHASWATGAVHLSYDALGRVDRRTFVDRDGFVAVEQQERHFDGRTQAVELYLPDTAYVRERIKYAYDGGGSLSSVVYEGPSGTQALYDVGVIDAFGRVREAIYGDAVEIRAEYFETGRRLPKSFEIETPTSRRMLVTADFDPLGRERSRTEERTDGTVTAPIETQAFGYDALGRLVTSTRKLGATTVASSQMTYDPLGNVLGIGEAHDGSDSKMSYRAGALGDRDRLCYIHYGDGAPPSPLPTCATANGANVDDGNVLHDGWGNVVSQATRGGVRTFSYQASGALRSIQQGPVHARFGYDAFGGLHEVEITSPVPGLARHDRSYGSAIQRRGNQIERRVPGPNGVLASRRGSSGDWLIPFGDTRGTRVVYDQAGNVQQDVRYRPFGETTSTGAQPGDDTHTTAQWNGGDALDAFGCLVQVGARLYDPCIGRFLSRDPLLVPRTASQTNPYAFAVNDPQNLNDPSGLDPAPETPPGGGVIGGSQIIIPESMWNAETGMMVLNSDVSASDPKPAPKGTTAVPPGALILPASVTIDGVDIDLMYDASTFQESIAMQRFAHRLESHLAEMPSLLEEFIHADLAGGAGGMHRYAQYMYETTGQYPGWYFTFAMLDVMSEMAQNLGTGGTSAARTLIKYPTMTARLARQMGMRVPKLGWTTERAATQVVSLLRGETGVFREGTRLAKGDVFDLALGLSEHLVAFKKRTGTRMLVEYPFDLYTGASRPLMDKIHEGLGAARSIHFNLEGFDFKRFQAFLQRGGVAAGEDVGPGQATMYEMIHIIRNHLDKTTFYNGHRAVNGTPGIGFLTIGLE
jgi:RHS repeat-associated protein